MKVKTIILDGFESGAVWECYTTLLLFYMVIVKFGYEKEKGKGTSMDEKEKDERLK